MATPLLFRKFGVRFISDLRDNADFLSNIPAKTTLIGVVGCREEGRLMVEMLVKERDDSLHLILYDPKRDTNIRTRMIWSISK